MERGRALTGSVGHPDSEFRGVVVKNDKNEGRTRLGAWIDIVRKMTPDDIAGRGFRPPERHHTIPVSNKLERTDFFFVVGADFLIWRTCAAVSGPSSWGY